MRWEIKTKKTRKIEKYRQVGLFFTSLKLFKRQMLFKPDNDRRLVSIRSKIPEIFFRLSFRIRSGFKLQTHIYFIFEVCTYLLSFVCKKYIVFCRETDGLKRSDFNIQFHSSKLEVPHSFPALLIFTQYIIYFSE